MRLFVNNKEVEALKEALRNAKPRDEEIRAKQVILLERVVLFEQLQGNIDKADGSK